MLCETYLQMVSGTGKPSLWFLVRNLGLRGGAIIVVANPDVILRQCERPVFSAAALPRFPPETYCTTRSQRPGESHLEFGGDIGWVLRFG